MNLVIVPNYVSEAIHEKMAAAFLLRPEPYWPSSDSWNGLYQQLLSYFDDHGVIPEFSVTKRGE